MPNTYDRGDLVRCKGTFKDSSGVAIDPGVVRFKVKSPAGTTTEYVYGDDGELVRVSVGVYQADINASLSGNWFYRFESEGVGQSAAETKFFVKASNFL